MKPIADEDLLLLILAAFRYALGRMSYITSTTALIIIDQWDSLPMNIKRVIQREIQQAIEQDLAGMACDIAYWQKVLDLPLKPGTAKVSGVPYEVPLGDIK